jgi:hypothetical protein
MCRIGDADDAHAAVPVGDIVEHVPGRIALQQ